MHGQAIAFDRAAIVGQPLAILDVKADVTAAVQCKRCPGGHVFLVRMSEVGTCPSCRRVFFVKNYQVQPNGHTGQFSVALEIGVKEVVGLHTADAAPARVPDASEN